MTVRKEISKMTDEQLRTHLATWKQELTTEKNPMVISSRRQRIVLAETELKRRQTMRGDVTADMSAKYLTRISKDICYGNECTEDEHHCESYAYFAVQFNDAEKVRTIRSMNLLDVCLSDYFQGYSGDDDLVFIALPFEGDGKELEEAIVANAD